MKRLAIILVCVLSGTAFAPTYKTNIGVFQGDEAGAGYRMNIGADQTDEAAAPPAAGGQVIIVEME